MVALVYVVAAGWMSVAPIRSAIADAQRPPVAVPARGLPGPVDARFSHRSEAAVGKIVARQAAVTFGPPLLVLWFGWDVWFAVIGFLPATGSAQRERAPLSPSLRRPAAGLSELGRLRVVEAWSDARGPLLRWTVRIGQRGRGQGQGFAATTMISTR